MAPSLGGMLIAISPGGGFRGVRDEEEDALHERGGLGIGDKSEELGSGVRDSPTSMHRMFHRTHLRTALGTSPLAVKLQTIPSGDESGKRPARWDTLSLAVMFYTVPVS